MVVGFVALAVMAFLLYVSGKAVVHHFWPPPASVKIILSAQLMPETGVSSEYLFIRGQASQGDSLVQSGQAKIWVNTIGEDFFQTMLVNITNGEFVVDGLTQGNLKFTDGTALSITVEIPDLKRDGVLASESTYVNTEKPLLPLSKMWLIVLLIVAGLVSVFLITFTGIKTEQKNRWAIVFSYVVILVFLALPLVVPVALPHLFPNLIPLMVKRSTPVGLVVAKIEDRKNPEPQWVLNIGGYVTALTNAPQISGAVTSSPAQISPNSVQEVVVHGGLAIPLYVVILSILGGAINMTRKVPLYQVGMETEQARSTNWISAAAQGALLGVAAIFRKQIPTGCETRDDESQAPAKQTQDNAKTNKQEHWRLGLLGLYMSLISAPFLGIVTFYLLSWLDFQRVSVLVIVSFSIGLMSEAIVTKITEVAAQFLNNNAKDAKEPEAEGN